MGNTKRFGLGYKVPEDKKPYRKKGIKIKFPKGLSIYERIKYIEQNIPNREIEAREEAKLFNITYLSYDELFRVTEHPITGEKQTIPPLRRLSTARKVYGLLMGKYQDKRGLEYARNYANKILQYADNELYDRFMTAMVSEDRLKILKEIKSVNMYYAIFKEKGVKKKRALLKTDEADNRIINDNINKIDKVLRDNGF